MLKKPLIVGLLCLCSFLFAMSATAEEGATLVLKSGERVSGELIDLGGVGFTMRVNGQTRRIGANEVAVIEFAGGNANADTLARLSSGQQVVLLKSGQVVEGRLYDIGGTRPLRITIDTASGRRDLSSSDVARIFLATPPGGAVALPAPAPSTPGTTRVAANQPWVDAGIDVKRGDRVSFSASGDIMIAPGGSSGVNGTPAFKSNQYPVHAALAGALIGKAGSSAPFLIGSNAQPIVMPADGRLMLGVNDDNHADNTGAFTVTVTTVQPRTGPFGR